MSVLKIQLMKKYFSFFTKNKAFPGLKDLQVHDGGVHTTRSRDFWLYSTAAEILQ